MGDSPTVAVIGAGFAGVIVGVRLKEKLGIHSFTIFEKSERFGGVWNDNKYPGVACDVLSHVYSFSFELNPDWSKKWSTGPEIQEYIERVAAKHDLHAHTNFGTQVVSAKWDSAVNQWRVRIRRSNGAEEDLMFKILISAVGQLNLPKYPDIPGLDSFEGLMMHTARWKPEADLTGKSVAVIGTGASAIQAVPELSKIVKALHVFQRTPPWILSRGNFAYPELVKSLFRNVPLLLRLYRLYWILKLESTFFGVHKFMPQIVTELFVVRHHRAQIKDPELFKKLTPSYPLGCKRVLLADDWFPTLQQPHVSLHTEPIVRITPTGIVTKSGDKEEETKTDVIVLGTGFHVSESLTKLNIEGANGQKLQDVWSAGPNAYRGWAVSGFPNFFIMYGPNTNLGHNSIVFMLEASMDAISQAIRAVQVGDVPYVEVTESAQKAFNDSVQYDLSWTNFTADCNSWYRTKDGKIPTQWGSFVFKYWLLTRSLNVDDFKQTGNGFASLRRAQAVNRAIRAAVLMAVIYLVLLRKRKRN